jgi:hypothetical protein
MIGQVNRNGPSNLGEAKLPVSTRTNPIAFYQSSITPLPHCIGVDMQQLGYLANIKEFFRKPMSSPIYAIEVSIFEVFFHS